MFVPSSHDSYCDLFFNCTPVDRASDSVMTLDETLNRGPVSV